MPKLGVVIEQGTKDWLEGPLDYGDSRSERVREALRAEKAAEDALTDSGFVDPNELPLEQIVYEAVSEWADGEPDIPTDEEVQSEAA